MMPLKELSLALASIVFLAQPALHAAGAIACDAGNGGLTLPAGFCAKVVANNLGEARHATVAPNGDLYVALLGGGVVALHDSKGDGLFDVAEKFGEGSVTGIELRNGYLWLAKKNSVERYKMTPGQLKPSGAPEVVVSGLPRSFGARR